MTEIARNREKVIAKKSPRRRMYQDVKLSTLLHPSSGNVSI